MKKKSNSCGKNAHSARPNALTFSLRNSSPKSRFCSPSTEPGKLTDCLMTISKRSKSVRSLLCGCSGGVNERAREIISCSGLQSSPLDWWAPQRRSSGAPSWPESPIDQVELICRQRVRQSRERRASCAPSSPIGRHSAAPGQAEALSVGAQLGLRDRTVLNWRRSSDRLALACRPRVDWGERTRARWPTVVCDADGDRRSAFGVRRSAFGVQRSAARPAVAPPLQAARLESGSRARHFRQPDANSPITCAPTLARRLWLRSQARRVCLLLLWPGSGGEEAPHARLQSILRRQLARPLRERGRPAEFAQSRRQAGLAPARPGD